MHLLSLVGNIFQLRTIPLHVLASKIQAMITRSNMVDLQQPGNLGVLGSAVSNSGNCKAGHLINVNMLKGLLKEFYVCFSIELSCC
jgi:hypothetical protein